jgi:hypothetical protein
MEWNPPGSPTLSSKTTGGEGTLCPISRVMTRHIRVYIKSIFKKALETEAMFTLARFSRRHNPTGTGAKRRDAATKATTTTTACARFIPERTSERTSETDRPRWYCASFSAPAWQKQTGRGFAPNRGLERVEGESDRARAPKGDVKKSCRVVWCPKGCSRTCFSSTS